MFEQVPAKNLASGDRVKFPRLGILSVVRITGSNTWSVQFVFSDGKKHTLERDRLLAAELITEKEPVPRGGGELLRLDLESGRVSVCSPSLYGFASEISESFQPLRGRVSSFADSIARDAVTMRGATLFTKKAIYWLPHAEKALKRAA